MSRSGYCFGGVLALIFAAGPHRRDRQRAGRERPQAMHGWATDHIPFPGACFRQMAEWLIRDDRLTKNSLVTARGPLALSSISCPVMNAVGTKDHIVPIESNRPLLSLLPGLDDLQFESGHVGLIVGGKAHRVTIPAMAEWLEEHSDRR